MTYKELQKQLKTLRENGKDVQVRLNSKKEILEKELARLHELEETNSVGKEEVLPLQEQSDLAESTVNKFSTKGERRPAKAVIKRANKRFSGGVVEYVNKGEVVISDGDIWCKKSSGSWLSSAYHKSTIMNYKIDRDRLTLSPPADYTKILDLYPRL